MINNAYLLIIFEDLLTRCAYPDRKRLMIQAPKFIYGEAKKCITSGTAQEIRSPFTSPLRLRSVHRLNLFMGIKNY